MTLILNGTDGLSDVDGTAATPAIRGTDANTGIFFPAADTIAFSEGGAEAMRIDSAGNLGIGTSSPSFKLDVSSATNNATVAKFSGAYSGSGTVALATFQRAGGAVEGAIRYNDPTTAIQFGTTTSHAATFITNGTERARIDTSGNLLVGTTTTTGNGCALEKSANGGRLYVGRSNADSVAEFQYSGTRVGQITITASTTSYVTSSDYRLKENVTPMTNALTKVAALKPVTYTWKSDGSVGQGFIAHELQEIVPDCVTGEKDAIDAEGNPMHQGVDTSFLVATLVAAIQEQQALINQLQADFAALKEAK